MDSTRNVIKIEKCNNITEGNVTICDSKLNIFFGRNGTGKSTIAQAIRLHSQGKPLAGLAPYGISDDTTKPCISGLTYSNIAIFDSEYLGQYVYQRDTLLKNTFEVLIRTPEYDNTKRNIDNALAQIKNTITGRDQIIALHKQLEVLINNIEFTGNNKLAKRKGGIKGVLDGKGAFFNPPEALKELSPFFEEDSVTKWAAWRLQGQEQFGAKGRCPYCATGDTDKTKEMSKVFSESFDKPSVEYAAAISKALDELANYLNQDKVKELLSLFGVQKDKAVLETQLSKLGIEAKYLNDRLTAILSFNGSSVDRNNLSALENTLNDMKIDLRACDTYFTAELTGSEMNTINSEIDNLLKKVNDLKREIGKYNKYVQDQVLNRKKDINDFLEIAGYKYTFDVAVDGENNARALLKFIKPDGTPADIQSPEQHLSWGEKHAFALILFMFDAISRNADLIILDDPISSFDSNKKYAIINRLFKTGDRQNSLYQRTVLLLTHDFEPVIDYIQVGGRQV